MPSYHTSLAAIRAAQGRSEEARSHYASAVEHGPTDIRAMNDNGLDLMRRGKFESSRQEFKNALLVKEESSGLHMNMAGSFC